MTDSETALAWARARIRGPLPLAADEALPQGMVRLARGDAGDSWAMPSWPDGATPDLLQEYDVPLHPVARAGETRRVLAACLRCCWADRTGPPWPGVRAAIDEILTAYGALIGRDDEMNRNWAIGALRRLHDSAWVIFDERSVLLGPRVAQWPAESHTSLRDLLDPPPAVNDGGSGS